MSIEIERKFLIDREFTGYEALAVDKLEITQGYLSLDPERTVRVRIIRSKGEWFKQWKYEAVMTIKTKAIHGSFSRGEWEFSIPHETAEQLIQVCVGALHKTRYIIPAKNSRKYEVDVFHGKLEDLKIVEIELGSEDEEFEKPFWFGKEVTHDSRYLNSNLIHEYINASYELSQF